MKLWEVMERIQLNGGNAPCELIIETEAIRKKYRIAGVNGRVNDVPAFLGGHEVNQIDKYFLEGNSFGIGYRVYI